MPVDDAVDEIGVGTYLSMLVGGFRRESGGLYIICSGLGVVPGKT